MKFRALWGEHVLLNPASWGPPRSPGSLLGASWGPPGDLLGSPGGLLGGPWRLQGDLGLQKASKSEAGWPEIHTFAKDFDEPRRRVIFEERGRSQEKHTFTRDVSYSMKSDGGLLRLNTHFYEGV